MSLPLPFFSSPGTCSAKCPDRAVLPLSRWYRGVARSWCCVFVGAAGFIWAGSAGAEPSVEPAVSVEFTVVGWGVEVDGLGYRQKGKLTPIDAPAYQRSRPYVYAGPRTMELYHVPAPAPSPATRIQGSMTPPLRVAATVTFDPTVRKATVLLAPSAKGCEAYVIPDDVTFSPPGMAVLLNLARSRIAVRCNQSEIVVLAPREHRLVSPGAQGVLDAAVAQEKGGSWQRAKRSYTPVHTNQQLVIVYFQTSSGDVARVALRQTFSPIELAQNVAKR